MGFQRFPAATSSFGETTTGQGIAVGGFGQIRGSKEVMECGDFQDFSTFFPVPFGVFTQHPKGLMK